MSESPVRGPPAPSDAAGADPGRLREALAEFAAETGLRFRIAGSPDGGPVWHDGLDGEPREELTRERWPVAVGPPLEIAVETPRDEDGRRALRLLRAVAPRLAAAAREAAFYGRELAERYEEVRLLTSIGETLGSIMQLERAAGHLLEGLLPVLDGRKAVLRVYDEATRDLVVFARAGDIVSPDRLPADEPESRQAEAFRRGRQLLAPGGEGRPPVAVVPVRHSPPHGSPRTVGVLALEGRPDRAEFSTGDAKLLGAVAGQIAAAIENDRLVRESLQRERILAELQLAHQLQLKLLPDLSDFTDIADVWARCEPAESVGGDFYHLFRLPGHRLGVMLGDVSSHGFSAGLIMALTMSAASIVAREEEQPGRVLRGIHQELVRKLESTEMYMTLCYAVLDPAAETVRWANAGHPHAFRLEPGRARRLEALNPPLGIAEFDTYAQRELPWRRGEDVLLMFTDGLSECLRTDQLWSDDRLTARAREWTSAPAREVVDRLFELACPPGGVAADDRTALVVK